MVFTHAIKSRKLKTESIRCSSMYRAVGWSCTHPCSAPDHCLFPANSFLQPIPKYANIFSVSSRKYFHIPGCWRKQLFHPLCLDKWAVHFNSSSATQHTQPSLSECGKDLLLCSVLGEDDGPDNYLLKRHAICCLLCQCTQLLWPQAKNFSESDSIFFSLKHR